MLFIIKNINIIFILKVKLLKNDYIKVFIYTYYYYFLTSTYYYLQF